MLRLSRWIGYSLVLTMLLWLNLSELEQNVGMLWLNSGLNSAETLSANAPNKLSQAQAIFERRPDDNGSQRGRANIAITQNNLDEARRLWLASGESERISLRGNAIGFNGSEQRNSVQNAMSWYVLAEPLNQENRNYWFGVGRLCRIDPLLDSVCQRAAARNNGNLLLNPDFDLGIEGWSQNIATGADIALVDCATETVCVRLKTSAETPLFAATIFQCVAVEAGAEYAFSAEISTIPPLSADQWRPVYAQGAVGGEQQGLIVSQAASDTGFHTYTNQFSAETYDDGLVCLHLARVSDSAEIVIKNPRFEKLKQ